MQIQCTKKLLEQLKTVDIIQDSSIAVDETSIFSWHANFVTINRHKSVILVNNQNRYVILLYKISKKDLKNIAELILDSIKKAFKAEGIRNEIIDRYLSEAKALVYTKSSSRSILSTLNSVEQEAWYSAEKFLDGQVSQPYFSLVMGDALRKIDGEYYKPIELLLEYLKIYLVDKESVLAVKSYQLMIRMDLEDYNVWRRIIVPEDITFRALHHAIQIVFDWKDYHIHIFDVFDGAEQVAYIGSTEECFDFSDLIECSIILDNKVFLGEYLPENYRVVYHYDSGDNWTHDIIVEKVMEDYPRRETICLGGEGERPPEDVGGESGYDEYLKVISDPKNPDYNFMVDWAIDQKAEEFNLDYVNARLKYNIYRLFD